MADARTMRGASGSSLTGDLLRPRPNRFVAFARATPLGVICLALLLIVLLFALLGPILGAGDPEKIDALSVFASPTLEYPMGNDYLGRSMMARLASGLRISFALALASALLAAAIGTALGLAAGYFAGWVDELVGRITDLLFAFPTILLGLLIVMIAGTGMSTLVATIVIATVPIFTRVARGPTLALKHVEYTVAARVSGASSGRILRRHILPNIGSSLLVRLAFRLSTALIAEAALSFLGLGVQPPQPSLGSLLRDGKTYMEIAPWTMFFPALTLAGVILAINLLGDELQAITDPRLRKR